MICKNCGLENPEGAKFCAGCGQKIEMLPQNNAPQNNIPQNNVQQNNIPQNNVPQNNVPQNNIPQYNVPQNNVPQNNIPQNNIPQNNIPQNNIPQNYVPQNNNFNNQVTFDPVTGQPIMNTGKKTDIKKHLPLIIGIAGGVAVVIVAIIVVLTIVGNSGINGVLNNLEDGINNKNVESIKKCVPEFVAKDMDIDQDDVDSLFGISDEYKFEIDFDVKSEKDVTDEESDSSNYTWKEYIQDEYEDCDDYDGGEVQEVKKASVKYDIDFENDTANAIAGLASSLSDESLTKDLYFVKYDGNWYLYDM